MAPLDTLMDCIVKDDKRLDMVPVCPPEHASSSSCVVRDAQDAVVFQDRTGVALTLAVKQNHTKVMVVTAPVLKLVHSVHTRDFLMADSGYHCSGRSMVGRLRARTGNVLRVSQTNHSDHFSLSELLAAADVDIDRASDVPGEETESLRNRGFQLNVAIHYSDRDPDAWMLSNFWGVRAMSYDVHVRHAAQSECKKERHGVSSYCVMINFRVSGERVEVTEQNLWDMSCAHDVGSLLVWVPYSALWRTRVSVVAKQ